MDGHVWRTAGRINSTFGGNLVDMVRATEILRVIEDDGLVERAAELGGKLLGRAARARGHATTS